jgi:hypothetical protein
MRLARLRIFWAIVPARDSAPAGARAEPDRKAGTRSVYLNREYLCRNQERAFRIQNNEPLDERASMLCPAFSF